MSSTRVIRVQYIMQRTCQYVLYRILVFKLHGMSESHDRLKRAREQAGFLTAAEAARAIGLPVPTYASYENNHRGFARHAPMRARRFGVTIDWLLNGEGEMRVGRIAPAIQTPLGSAHTDADTSQDLPILGTAAASIIGAVTLSQPIGYLRRPPALLSTPDAYALYVAGDSMEPRYRSGDVVYVNPHRPCRQGDDVVIQTRLRAGDDITGYVKTLVSRSPREVVARQYNPASTIEYRATTVIAVHRVLSAHELVQG